MNLSSGEKGEKKKKKERDVTTSVWPRSSRKKKKKATSIAPLFGEKTGWTALPFIKGGGPISPAARRREKEKVPNDCQKTLRIGKKKRKPIFDVMRQKKRGGKTCTTMLDGLNRGEDYQFKVRVKKEKRRK